MRASLAQRLKHQLRLMSVFTGLPLDYVRKSPRKNAPHVIGSARPVFTPQFAPKPHLKGLRRRLQNRRVVGQIRGPLVQSKAYHPLGGGLFCLRAPKRVSPKQVGLVTRKPHSIA